MRSVEILGMGLTLAAAVVSRAVDAPFSTVPFAAPTNLYYNAATGQFVGSGSMTPVIYQQYDPDQGPRPVGPNPPPPPVPPINENFAIDDVHMSNPGTYQVTSLAFGLYIAPGNSGPFNALVRVFGNDPTNTLYPTEINGPAPSLFQLQINGLPAAAGTYRVVVFNISFYAPQHLWVGVSPQSLSAAMILASDAVEIGSSSDLIAWDGYLPNYPKGIYTFAGASPKADLTLELGGTNIGPTNYLSSGPESGQFGGATPWYLTSAWQQDDAGNWFDGASPSSLDFLRLDLDQLGRTSTKTRLPDSAPSNLAASITATSGISRFVGAGGGVGQLRLGGLTVGDVNMNTYPSLFVGTQTVSAEAGTLFVSGPTMVKRGDMIVTQGSSAALGQMQIGVTAGATVDSRFFVDAAAASVTSLFVNAGDVHVLRSGTFANSAGTTIGTNFAGFISPGFTVGDAADSLSTGIATQRDDVTMYTGDLVVRNSGSSLTIGLSSDRANLLIGDDDSPAGIVNPCFLVERGGQATIHRQIKLERGEAIVRSGGIVTSTFGGSNVSVLIGGSINPCFLVGDSTGGGSLHAQGTLRVAQGELRLGHSAAWVECVKLDVQAQGLLAGRGTVEVTGGAVAFNGSLSPGEEPAVMGWGALAGEMDFEVSNLALGAGAVTTMDLGAGRATSDRVMSTANLTPGGTLVLRPVEGSVPPVGAGSQIFSAQGAIMAGSFAAVDDSPMRQAARRATVEYRADEVVALVLCPSDFDYNGFVNGDDFDQFVIEFEAGTAAADHDGNTFVNGDDFDRFGLDFEAGC